MRCAFARNRIGAGMYLAKAQRTPREEGEMRTHPGTSDSHSPATLRLCVKLNRGFSKIETLGELGDFA